jgi:hypothetical protein
MMSALVDSKSVLIAKSYILLVDGNTLIYPSSWEFTEEGVGSVVVIPVLC